ncbi:MAG: MalY/PatB family protein [Lachnospiraceae bacterium]|jgi:cystathionine beta-lyase
MKYDFDTVIDRTGKDSIAVEQIPVENAPVREGVSRIPMWVADMNFATVPDIPEMLAERAKHPLYGYFSPRKEYTDAILTWQKKRNGLDLTADDILYQNGVLGGLATAVRAFTAPGDGILLHSPCYIGFLHTLEQYADRRMVFSPLVRDGQGVWRMDFADMEKKIRGSRVTCMVFCSPHNPTGRVWERGEIEQAMELCAKYDLTVVSDEIWSDLILPGNHHTPTAGVSADAAGRTIAMYAPSKTFNLAGLVGSYSVVRDPGRRAKMKQTADLTMYNSMNLLSMYALIGGYSGHGAEWVDELTQVILRNVEETLAFFAKAAPEIRIAKPQGTYMLYLDCGEWCAKHKTDIEKLLKAGIYEGVIWQDGRPFRMPDTIRMNLALPKALLDEALARLGRVFAEFG